MAQIDPSIAMGFRPIQIESPINQMAAISQLEGARQQRQMNMLQMQEYARKAKEDQELAAQQNELAKIHSSGIEIGSPAYFNLVSAKAPRLLTNIMDQQTKREALTAQKEAREAETKKREFELGQQKEKLSKEKVNQAMADIAGFDDLVSINADIDKKLKSGELTQDQANQIRSGLPADDSGIPAWQRASLMKLMDLKDRLVEQQKQKERVAPKWEFKKIGSREVLVDVNPYSSTVGQRKAGAEALEDTEPKWEYKKVGSREVLVDVNPHSSTVGQIKPYAPVLEDTEPKWELRKVGSKEVLVDTNPYSATVGQMKAGAEALVDRTPKPEKIEQDGKIFFIDSNPYSDTYGQRTGAENEIVNTDPKWTARDIGGSIVYVDENRYSKTFGQQKSGAAITKTAPPVAATPPTESPLAKLIRERRELEASDPKNPLIKKYDAAIAKETAGTPPEIVREYEYAVANGQFRGTLLQFKEAFARAGRPLSISQAAPTVTMVLDPADPTRMLSIDAKVYKGGSLGSPGVIGIAGKEPAGAKKQADKDTAQENAGTIIAQLRQSFDQLDKLGGVTSTQNRPGTNFAAALSSSSVGQFTGRIFGTEAQSERNKIAQTRPLLMTTIMQAMGLSAKQLDSNAELKLWLSAATDPTLDLEANRAALNSLENLLTNKNKGRSQSNPAPKSDVRSRADAILGKP